MRIGLIARADHRGLAIQTAGFYRAMQPTKTMVIDCPSAKPLPLHLDQYPGEGVSVINGLPTADDFRSWLQGLDVVYTAETSYNKAFWSEAERAGVKTVIAPNYEFLDVTDRPTLWAAPSMWHYGDIPFANKTFLPVPIELDRFKVNQSERATNFLHVIGRPAVHDRNGSLDLLKALQYVTAEVTVTLRCQEPGYVSALMPGLTTKDNVTLRIESGDVPDYWSLYEGNDVLVLPRRFGGLSLPVNEALGAGMPVIMPDISPNNLWLPSFWLVPATKTGSFLAKQHIDIHETAPKALAAKIDQFATDRGFFMGGQTIARELAEELSWDNMRGEYLRVLGAL